MNYKKNLFFNHEKNISILGIPPCVSFYNEVVRGKRLVAITIWNSHKQVSRHFSEKPPSHSSSYPFSARKFGIYLKTKNIHSLHKATLRKGKCIISDILYISKNKNDQITFFGDMNAKIGRIQLRITSKCGLLWRNCKNERNWLDLCNENELTFVNTHFITSKSRPQEKKNTRSIAKPQNNPNNQILEKNTERKTK